MGGWEGSLRGLFPAGSQGRRWGYELPGPRSKWELLGIPPRVLIGFHSLWGGAEGGAGATGGCTLGKAGMPQLSSTWGGAGGGGGAERGGLSCHIPEGECSWVPCPYLGRRCLLTSVCRCHGRTTHSHQVGGAGRAQSELSQQALGWTIPPDPDSPGWQVQPWRRQTKHLVSKNQQPPFVGGLLWQPVSLRGRSYSRSSGLWPQPFHLILVGVTMEFQTCPFPVSVWGLATQPTHLLVKTASQRGVTVFYKFVSKGHPSLCLLEQITRFSTHSKGGNYTRV